ncbi:MAG: hypothetical protein K8I82_21820 [Anaerolineae bacterium]|jgi:hypothetical protein|nr:hypothetical protein [Anaerolineae bacterium]
MMKRIEFTLNLDDPQEAAIYRALQIPLQRRRAGAVIRQALEAHLLSTRPASRGVPPAGVTAAPDEGRTERIMEQSAAMFGF